MQNIFAILCLILGMAIGAGAAWLVFRVRQAVLTERLESRDQQYRDLEAGLRDTFQALSAEALRSNNQAFLELAKTTLEKAQVSANYDLEKRQQAIVDLMKPVQDSLQKVDAKIGQLESARAGAYAAITEQVRGLLDSQNQLRTETSRLVTALRTPSVRGHWSLISTMTWRAHCAAVRDASMLGPRLM